MFIIEPYQTQKEEIISFQSWPFILFAGIICAVVLLIVLLLLIFLRKRILIAIALIKESSRYSFFLSFYIGSSLIHIRVFNLKIPICWTLVKISNLLPGYIILLCSFSSVKQSNIKNICEEKRGQWINSWRFHVYWFPPPPEFLDSLLPITQLF